MTARGLILVLGLTCVAAQAQSQLMNPYREAAFRQLIPRLEDSQAIMAKVDQALLYTDQEIPPAYQFQPLAGGVGTSHTLFFSPSHRHNRIDKYTQGNSEFPWRSPGGLNHVAESQVDEVRFLWLPPNPAGGVWPVVVWRGELERSQSVNMPAPTAGWRWMFPAEAIVGEVLLKRFADGTWAAYEVRMRLREIDAWDVEIYRPFRDVHELEKLAGEPVLERVAVVRRAMRDTFHAVPAFDRAGAELVLPPIRHAQQLLRAAIFRPVGGASQAETQSHLVDAVTADDHENIVPAGYSAGYLGTTAESCRNCHQHTLKHVDAFDPGRDWYGYIRGSDGIFSFHPIEPDAIRPGGGGQTRLRRQLVEAGIVAMFDPAKHPDTVYRQIAAFTPTGPTGQPTGFIQGGQYR